MFSPALFRETTESLPESFDGFSNFMLTIRSPATPITGGRPALRSPML